MVCVRCERNRADSMVVRGDDGRWTIRAGMQFCHRCAEERVAEANAEDKRRRMLSLIKDIRDDLVHAGSILARFREE